jgi:hypothetical protein
MALRWLTGLFTRVTDAESWRDRCFPTVTDNRRSFATAPACLQNTSELLQMQPAIKTASNLPGKMFRLPRFMGAQHRYDLFLGIETAFGGAR